LNVRFGSFADIRWPSLCAISRHPASPFLYYRSFTPMYRRNWLLSASISFWTSWTSGNVQNHAVPNTSFRLSNSKVGKAVLAFGSVLALPVGKVTRLMTKDLPDVPGKEGMVETVDFAPGEVSQPHRHNADLFVYVLEGSVITQVKGGSPQTVRAGEVFYESPSGVHIVSRNASDTQPAKLLVFYVKAKGTPPTVLLGDDER